MIKRVRSTKIGDIFECVINAEEKCYLQYIISDMSQLNCDVVRVFRKKYPLSETPSLCTILDDDILFYIHCDSKAGIIKNVWSLYGNDSNVGDINNVFFRMPLNPENMHDATTSGWVVWSINGELIQIERLTAEQKSYGLGYIFPVELVFQIINGSDSRLRSCFVTAQVPQYVRIKCRLTKVISLVIHKIRLLNIKKIFTIS